MNKTNGNLKDEFLSTSKSLLTSLADYERELLSLENQLTTRVASGNKAYLAMNVWLSGVENHAKLIEHAHSLVSTMVSNVDRLFECPQEEPMMSSLWFRESVLTPIKNTSVFLTTGRNLAAS